MKKIVWFFLAIVSKTSLAMAAVHVFVSFSMPETLLIQTFREAEQLNLPVYIKGLHQNSMKLTAQKIMEYTKEVPSLSLQIDPTLFDKYGINQVPAIVSDNGQVFDVIYGNLKLKEALKRIIDEGETGLTLTNRLED